MLEPDLDEIRERPPGVEEISLKLLKQGGEQLASQLLHLIKLIKRRKNVNGMGISNHLSNFKKEVTL